MTPEQASQKYKWVKYNSSTNTVELYLDHHMLSWARMCEAGFYFQHILKINPSYKRVEAPKIPILRPTNTEKEIIDSTLEGLIDNQKEESERLENIRASIHKPWFLEFGEYLHYMFEIYYKSFIHREKSYILDYLLSPTQQCLNLTDFLNIGKKVWNLMDIEWFAGINEKKPGNVDSASHKRYYEVGGWKGVSSLLTQYYVYYQDLRVRIIDTEIIFGYNKEVKIGEFNLITDYWKERSPYGSWDEDKIETIEINCFLTGRIDLLIDNGYKIGPVDHKHSHKFYGDESDHYNPQDAITGYILATREIMQRNYPKYFETGRECLSAWVYHICATEPSEPRDKNKSRQPRFKTTPIDKSPQQLEDFKKRQLSTFKRIAELLFNDKTPEWNTLVCNNIFNRDCMYKDIHERSPEQWENIIREYYLVGQEWNPRERDSDKIDEILKIERI